MRLSRLLLAPLVLVPAFLAPHALAGGSLSFTTTPVTVSAGQTPSFMNAFSDCAAPCALTGGFALPLPSATPMTLTTSRDSNYLKFVFTIPDRSHTPATGFGERIIVQIDPNQSRTAPLQAGTGSTADYRFEFKIKGNAINEALWRVGTGSGGWAGSASDTWNTDATLCPTSFCDTRSGVTNRSSIQLATAGGASDYTVTLNIALDLVGINSTPVNDMGLAIAVINDLLNTGTLGSDLAAVTFPYGDMPASQTPFLDPGLVHVPPVIGVWSNPGVWGTGFFGVPPSAPAQITLSHSPAIWLSDSIRLSLCDTGRWEDVAGAAIGVDQSTLGNWYKYQSADPCQMGVWVKANNSGALANARLLVVWHDPGLTAANNWRVVELTDPITFSPGDSTVKITWKKVPFGGSSGIGGSHPCLRVYVLPEVLNGVDTTTLTNVDAARINLIANATGLGEFERAYGFNVYPWTQQAAQMNFNNLDPGSCTAGSTCYQVGGPYSEWRQFLFATLESLGPRAAWAQPAAAARRVATPVNQSARPPATRGDPFALVMVHGFAIPEKKNSAKEPYLIHEPINGLGWAIPLKMLREPMTLKFAVGNPALLHREFVNKKAREVKAPPRRILLVAKTDAPKGVKPPTVKVPVIKGAMKPGAERKVEIVVGAVKPGPGGDAKKPPKQP